MQELRLVAVSEDGSYLVLATAGRGTRFTLPVDDRLRAAVRGHFSRLGQFEIEVESPLRPKEIQARIRAGETAEEIAESAGIPVERVRWFEGPVLQEREYMAQQAQRVTVRRQGESAPAPPLGEMVEDRLGRRGVDLEEVEWDSWKCEDNTWRVRLSFFDDGRPNAAEWIFDPRRRQVSPLDEEAATLSSQTLDESVAAPVTPLVPRRPAMKIVSDSRPVSRRDDAAAGRITDPMRRPAVPSRWEPASADERLGFATFEEQRYGRNADIDPPGDMDAVAAATGVYNDDSAIQPGEIAVPEQVRPTGPEASPVRPVEPAAATAGDAADEAEVRPEPAPSIPARPVGPEHPAAVEAEPASAAAPAAPGEGRAEPETVTAAEPASAEPAAARSEAAAADAEAAPEATQDVPAATTKAPAAAAAEPATEPAAEPAAEPRSATPAEPGASAPAGRPEPAAPSEAPSEAPAESPVETPAASTPPAPKPSPPGQPAPAKPAPGKPTPRGRHANRPADQPAATRPAADQPAGRPAPKQPSPAEQPGKVPAAVAAEAASADAPAQSPRNGRRKSARSRRASVPSWDEIMFGARRPE
jgi:hypothetical protein